MKDEVFNRPQRMLFLFLDYYYLQTYCTVSKFSNDIHPIYIHRHLD